MNERIIAITYLGLLFLTSCGTTTQVPTTLSGEIKELGSEGLEGVTVCVANTDPDLCTQTDDAGMYILESVHAGADLSFTMTKEGYLGGTVSFTTALEPSQIPVVSMGGDVLMELQMGILNVEAVEQTGQIAFSISNGINGDGVNIPNIETRLEPSSGDGPFYSNDSGLPDHSLTQTSANGGGVYVNVEPGIYSLVHLNIAENCTPMLGWGLANAPSFEVFPNRVTYR